MGSALDNVSLFDLKVRFFVPTREVAQPPRGGAVKAGRCADQATARMLRGRALTAPSTAAPWCGRGDACFFQHVPARTPPCAGQPAAAITE